MYALIALGYTLVYGIMLMINFAHSEMFMAGAYVGLFTLNALTIPNAVISKQTAEYFTTSGIGLTILFVIVFGVAMIAVGIMGVLTERLAYRPLRNAPRLAPLISAIGVSIFLQNAVLLWVDSKALPFPRTLPVMDIPLFGTASVSTLQIFILVTVVVLLILLDTFVSKTRIGKAMRATSQDRDAAGLMGININNVIALAFFIGPALGAVAGIFNGMYYGTVNWNMGFIPGIKSFTAAVIGGIGNLRGAMLGGFTLGIIESLSAGFLSAGYKDVIAFIILILVLIFRPGGLLGESVVEKV
ncbi:MAG: branched-chain amino acid ABC transporter permease [Coriobacteriia bacterium]|nr:branched-chain amino acid ABC transporter permease [Coriobacteriia bacterium]